MRSHTLPSLAVFIAAVWCGCGEQTTSSTANTAPDPSPSLLTGDEMDALFLKDTQIWKFSSQPGIAAKSVRLQLIDDGKPISSTTSRVMDGGLVTAIIVVAQQLDKQHVLKFYVKHTGGSSLSTSGAWFAKPLQESAAMRAMPAPILIGTTMLVCGSSELGGERKTTSFSSENAPSRLELVIE